MRGEVRRVWLMGSRPIWWRLRMGVAWGVRPARSGGWAGVGRGQHALAWRLSSICFMRVRTCSMGGAVGEGGVAELFEDGVGVDGVAELLDDDFGVGGAGVGGCEGHGAGGGEEAEGGPGGL